MSCNETKETFWTTHGSLQVRILDNKHASSLKCAVRWCQMFSPSDFDVIWMYVLDGNVCTRNWCEIRKLFWILPWIHVSMLYVYTHTRIWCLYINYVYACIHMYNGPPLSQFEAHRKGLCPGGQLLKPAELHAWCGNDLAAVLPESPGRWRWLVQANGLADPASRGRFPVWSIRRFGRMVHETGCLGEFV